MKTIKNEIEKELTIKNSRFITIIKKIDDNSNINNIIDKVKLKYPNATHYCYAYITPTKMKSSDDKEPGGTAGLPMLNVLLKNELTNVLAITTRYFGGIKLGAGGLVRAYTKSITNALNNTTIINLIPGLKIEFKIDYQKQKDLNNLLNNIDILETKYNESITYQILIPEKDYNKFSLFHPNILQKLLIEEKNK